MTAVETLERLAGDCWPCDLRAHLIGGIVVAYPDFAVLLRPVWREWTPDKLRDPWEVAPDGDCWFIWALAGNPTACFRAAWTTALAAGIDPWKKWVAFERGGSLRVRDFGSLHTHLFKPCPRATEARPKPPNNSDATTNASRLNT